MIPTKTFKEIEAIEENYIRVLDQGVFDLLREQGIEPEFMHDGEEPPF